MATGITASARFAEWEACVTAGLDPYLWDRGVYPPKFKAKALAWYEGHQLAEQHKADAQAQAAKRKADRK